MKRKINEAEVKVDIQGLESSDLETLSRMLALAGQAEQSANPMTSELPKMRPFEFDSAAEEETPAIIGDDDMNPSDELGSVVDDLADEVEDLDGSVTDFGSDDVSTEMSLDMDGQPAIEYETSDDDMFDMDRMSSLAGLGESLEDGEDFSDEEEAEEALDESQLLPDLSLDEDAESIEGNGEHGPFRTEAEAVRHASETTNGTEGDNFSVVPRQNMYFWKRLMQEEQQTTEPDPEFIDMDGIENSRHEYRPKRPGTALGDNPLAFESIDELDNEAAEAAEQSAEDDEETVDDILESLNLRYKKFIGE